MNKKAENIMSYALELLRIRAEHGDSAYKLDEAVKHVKTAFEEAEKK